MPGHEDPKGHIEMVDGKAILVIESEKPKEEKKLEKVEFEVPVEEEKPRRGRKKKE